MTINRVTKRIKRQKRQRIVFNIICICLCISILVTLISRKYLLSANADQKSLCNKDLLLIPPYATKKPRATILDRAGAVLAISQKRALVYAIPSQISNLLDTTKKISDVLGISKEKLLNLLNSSTSLCILKDNLKLSIAKDIAKLNLSGIGISYYYIRVYPYKKLLNNIVGRLGPSGQGVSGIEYSYNTLLNKGLKTLTLSLDINLESASQKILKWQMAKLRAKTGCFLLMNIRDGSLIALSSYKREKWFFKPNRLALKAEISPIIMWPILEAVLKNNGDTQEQIIYKNKSWHVLDTSSEEMAFWGPINPSLSDNYNCKNIISILVSLGFGQKTGIDLPEEEAGYIMPISNCSLTPLIFKNTKVTAIQLLVAFSKILLNHGHLIPHLVIDKKLCFKNNNILFSKDKIESLIKTISEGRGISLASITFKKNNYSKFASTKYPAQVVALGFYPTKAPQVVYVLVLNDVKRDPRCVKGVLAQSYLVAQRASQVILAQKFIRRRFGSFWASINIDEDHS